MLREGAQGLEELRSQKQHRQTTEQGQRGGRTVIDIAQQTKPHVHGDDGNGHRGKKLQYRRREKCQPKRAHTQAAILVGGIPDVLLGSTRMTKQLQRRHAAYAVDEMRREPGNGSELLLVETLCPHTDQRHEQRNQWRREQQEDDHQIIEPAYHRGNQQWQQ